MVLTESDSLFGKKAFLTIKTIQVGSKEPMVDSPKERPSSLLSGGLSSSTTSQLSSNPTSGNPTNLISFVSPNKVLIPVKMFKKWLVIPTTAIKKQNLKNVLLKYEATQRVRQILSGSNAAGNDGEINYMARPSLIVAIQKVKLSIWNLKSSFVSRFQRRNESNGWNNLKTTLKI